MRVHAALFGLVVLSVAAVSVSAAESMPSLGRWHVRAVAGESGNLIGEAIARSPIVAALADDLERTDVIVYVSEALVAGFPRAYMTFLGSGPGVRYLLIRIDRWLAPTTVRIGWLAHELQHALEVARSPEVRDEAGLAGLYRRIGWEHTKGRFESDAALSVERRVAEELTRPSTPKRPGDIAHALGNR